MVMPGLNGDKPAGKSKPWLLKMKILILRLLWQQTELWHFIRLDVS